MYFTRNPIHTTCTCSKCWVAYVNSRMLKSRFSIIFKSIGHFLILDETPTEEGSCPVLATIYASYQELFGHTLLRMAPPAKASLHSQTIYFHLFHHSSLTSQAAHSHHPSPSYTHITKSHSALHITSLFHAQKTTQSSDVEVSKHHISILWIGPVSLPFNSCIVIVMENDGHPMCMALD